MDAAVFYKMWLPDFQTAWHHIFSIDAMITTLHNLKVFNCCIFLKKYICSCQVSLKYLASTKSDSAFNAANLLTALELIEAWERKLDPSSPESSEIIR
jgi:hypothetical protein